MNSSLFIDFPSILEHYHISQLDPRRQGDAACGADQAESARRGKITESVPERASGHQIHNLAGVRRRHCERTARHGKERPRGGDTGRTTTANFC